MNKERFVEELKKNNILLNNDQLNKLEKYYKLLKTYNQKFNLTSIINKEDVYLKHFYDSLCIFQSNKIKPNSLICDLGTGAGFPGVVIAVYDESIQVDLLESNTKKCNFLNVVKEELELKNINIINSRAETYAKQNREKYDIVTSRAVSALNILSELSIPLVKVNGYFLPLKGNALQEIDSSKNIIKELDSKIENYLKYTLPIENSCRSLLEIKKTKKTSRKYPREYSKIKKEKK